MGPGAAAGIAQGVGTIIGGGLNLLTSHFDRKAAKEMQRDANVANLHLSNVAFAENKKMWDRQNLYNSPQEQMKRLIAAGLNPNLVYGKGAVGNTAGQMPSYNPPEIKAEPIGGVNWAGIIPAMQDIKMKAQQTDNLAAGEEKIKADTLLSAASKAKAIADADLKREILANNEKIRGYQHEALDLNNRKLTAEIFNKALKGLNIEADTALKTKSLEKMGYSSTIEGVKAELAKEGLFSNDDLLLRLFTQGKLDTETLLMLALPLLGKGAANKIFK